MNEDLVVFEVLLLLIQDCMDVSIELIKFDCPSRMSLVAVSILFARTDHLLWFLKDDVLLSWHKGYILRHYQLRF